MADDDAERKVQCAAITAAGTRCRKTALPGTSRCSHHSFKVPGRPSKLTPELVERILDSVLGGAYFETAAQAAGVNKTTLYRWLRRADDLEAAAAEHTDSDAEFVDVYAHTDPAHWVYLDFRHALKSAEAYVETDLLGRARGAGLGWQAFMTILERRFPDRWGRRKVLDHTFAAGLEERRKVELIVPEDQPRALKVAELLATAGALDEDDDAGELADV